MKVLNFSHPLTAEQKQQIESLTGEPIQELIEIRTQFDFAKPFDPQVEELLDKVGWVDSEWVDNDFVVNLPSLSIGAGLMTAKIMDRRYNICPLFIRMSPVHGVTPPKFEVVEII